MDWKEHPHLFANGEFIVRHEDGYNGYINGLANYPGVFDKDELQILTDYYDGINFLPISECTLIARRIEDMDSEELLETHYIADPHADVNEYDEDEWRQVLTQWADLDDLSFATARQLISLGVYPGPQTHFGETVIDINEV